jgi:hypothetical protein
MIVVGFYLWLIWTALLLTQKPLQRKKGDEAGYQEHK